MVEMTETANILHNATENSLVLMDEIGRGTSTYDGLSLAWACAEHLALKVKALTLFATHYFELTTLVDELTGCENVHLDAVEHGDTLVFLHKVKPGTVNKSYGLQVATLAGVPREVVERAKDKLQQLEQGVQIEKRDLSELEQEQPANAESTTAISPSKTADRIKETQLEKMEVFINNMQPDELSPRDALDLIYQLKKLL